MTESQFLDALRDVSIQQVLDEASNITENAETPEYSEEFNENMEKLRQKYGNAPKKSSIRPIYRAASIILVAVLTLGLMTISVRAFFPEIWQVFVSWFEDYASVSFEGAHNDSSSELEELMEPSYVPEGLEIERSINTGGEYLVEYCMENRIVIQYTQDFSRDILVYIDSSYDFRTIEISGYNGYLGINEDTRIIVWDDGKYGYRLIFDVTDISEDVAKQMAESITKK